MTCKCASHPACPRWWRLTLLPAALLALLLWVLLRQRPLKPIRHTPPIELTPVKPTAAKKPPAAPPAAAQKADDLTRIAGIGPKAAEALKAAGTRTYADLANASPEQLKQILSRAGMRALNPESWKQQAALAAASQWEELAALISSRKSSKAKK